MTHPLVLQLRFTRSEFKRALAEIDDNDARQRLTPMNCISWNIGHLAWQEQRYWLYRLQDKVILPELNEEFCYGCPAFSPALDEIWQMWQTIIDAVDPFLDTLTNKDLLQQRFLKEDPSVEYTAGNLMQRVIYHYWYHTGESMAIRQILGHRNLPEFVGNIDDEAPYQPH